MVIKVDNLRLKAFLYTHFGTEGHGCEYFRHDRLNAYGIEPRCKYWRCDFDPPPPLPISLFFHKFSIPGHAWPVQKKVGLENCACYRQPPGIHKHAIHEIKLDDHLLNGEGWTNVRIVTQVSVHALALRAPGSLQYLINLISIWRLASINNKGEHPLHKITKE